MTAVFCGRTGDDNRIDPPLAQNDVQIGAEEPAVAVLFDDVLARLGREFWVDFDTRRTVHPRGATGDPRVHVIKQPHNEAVPTMYVRGIHDPDTRIPAKL